MIITTKPNDGYELASLKVNNVEMISSVADNVLEYTIGEKIVSVDVKFTKIPVSICDITYDDLGGKGSYEAKQNSVKAGEKLTVKINPEEGYQLETVTFSGEKMEKIAENTYEILVQESGTVLATFTEIKKPAQESNLPSESGCSASLGFSVGGLISLLGISLVLLKRKNEK